ncbi:MAG: hypothetical protein B7Y33_04265 [Hydrogenophilales bacterium 16-62-9]|nr:MAG: hypothetical protein B7Y33_04265 [Hydrogenophilales bacterium 16-62-9]
MRKTQNHLDDEHMRLYEWSGTGAACAVAAQYSRVPPRHAACGVLALMTSFLILGGCNSKSPAAAISDRGDELNPKKESLYEAAKPKPAPEESPEATGDAVGAAPAAAPAH